MAKKQHNESSDKGNYGTVKTFAFWGLLLTGVAGLLSVIVNIINKFTEATWTSKVSGICSLIALISLYISVWLAAWDYVKPKGKSWRILYAIGLILSLLLPTGIGLLSF